MWSPGLDGLSESESVAAGQNLFREDEVFVWLGSRCHPGTQTFIQKDVLGVEGLEFGIFCCSDFQEGLFSAGK